MNVTLLFGCGKPCLECVIHTNSSENDEHLVRVKFVSPTPVHNIARWRTQKQERTVKCGFRFTRVAFFLVTLAFLGAERDYTQVSKCILD